jgi:hypothetical protein
MVMEMVEGIIERELRFQKMRDEIKRELLMQQDFARSKAFEIIGKGKECLEVGDLS